MSFAILKPQIKTLLSNISVIQDTAAYPKVKFDGYPAASVEPSSNSADYETTTENIRTYAFIVRVFYETKNTGIENALEALEEVVDDVIDAFDQEDLKTSSTRTVGIGLPSDYTFINVWANPSAWGTLPEEQLIMAEINVRVRVSIDVT